MILINASGKTSFYATNGLSDGEQNTGTQNDAIYS